MHVQHKIERRRLSELKDYPSNPNRHSKRQIAKLAKNVRKNGFIGVIVVNRAGYILAGHARRLAAIMAGLDDVDCVVVENLSEAEERAFLLADNRMALDGVIDINLVALQLDKILELDPETDFSLTGYDEGDLDQIRIELNPEDTSPSVKDEVLPDLEEGPTVSKLGDLIALGNNRLICGDSRDAQTFARLMDSESAAMVISDAPWNKRVSSIGSSGRIKHREFQMASGEMTRAEFIAFLVAVFSNLTLFSTDGSIHFQFIDWAHMHEMLEAGEKVYSALKNVCVWDKGVGGMGTFFRSRHEMVFVWKSGTAPHINTFGLGEKGRYRTNVWNYRGLNTGGANRMEELSRHPTAKPVQMLADAMLDCSMRNSIVLDPFGGSGSTLIAAEKTGRRARLIEIDPIYIDRIIRRWQKYAKEDAVFLDNGETFNEREARQKRLRAIVRPGRTPTSRIVNFAAGGLQ